MQSVRVVGINGELHLTLEGCSHGADVRRAISASGCMPKLCNLKLLVGSTVLQDDALIPFDGRDGFVVTAVASLEGFGVVTWGHGPSGGDSTAVFEQLACGVVSIAASELAFAALKQDGSVVTWGYFEPRGSDVHEGTSSEVASRLAKDVVSVVANREAFAAVKQAGEVVTWGRAGSGGRAVITFSFPDREVSVSDQLRAGVHTIVAGRCTFAALKNAGGVVTWGDATFGADSSSVEGALAEGVASVVTNTNCHAFAAIKQTGSVVTWGVEGLGGNSNDVAEDLATGVYRIVGNSEAFAALKQSGSVVTWGHIDRLCGRNSSAVCSRVADHLQSGVKSIVAASSSSSGDRFVAVKIMGSVVIWGRGVSFGGGNGVIYQHAVQDQLEEGVDYVVDNGNAIAAVKHAGEVVTWGRAVDGGDSSAVAENLAKGVVSLTGSSHGFTALLANGSVVTWGGVPDTTGVADQLASDVVQVFSDGKGAGFAAIKEKGSVVTWGRGHGGDSSSVHDMLRQGVVNIVTNSRAFAALKRESA